MPALSEALDAEGEPESAEQPIAEIEEPIEPDAEVSPAPGPMPDEGSAWPWAPVASDETPAAEDVVVSEASEQPAQEPIGDDAAGEVSLAEEPDALRHRLEGRVRIEQHEPVVEGQPQSPPPTLLLPADSHPVSQ